MENVMEIKESSKLNKILKLIFERIIPYLLVAVFAARIMAHSRDASDNIKVLQYIGLDSSPFGKGQTILALLAYWLGIVATIVCTMRHSYEIKAISNIVKFVTIPIYIFNIIMAPAICRLLCVDGKMLIFNILYYTECGLGLIISGYHLIKEVKLSVDYKQILWMFGILLLLMIPALPTFFVQFTYGLAKGYTNTPKGMGFTHRLLIYLGIIMPVAIYFILRNKPQQVIRFSLIFISCAVLSGFMINYNFKSLTEPWAWPFHLCNTALFVLPICLIFRTKKLFYFTYFINIIGALFAMMMPNYSDTANILSAEMFRFWYNHWIAFFMPLLGVALKEFKRPGLKEFGYSLVAFAAYFILALFMNVYFTSIGHFVDYFFLNKVDTVADKLGNFGRNIFNVGWSVNVNGLVWEFHPLYQVLFFLVYVVLELVEWFIYGEFFRIATQHYDLHLKLHTIKIHKYAYEQKLTEEMKKEMMENQTETKLELKNFSKKYGSNKNYSVENASLEVYGGEIFGFLGPNGAGKSTIIKSTVGIQPITEGSIEVCGYDVANEPVKAKANIGYVPDHYALYEKLTGREYINYIADIFEVSKEERDERLNKYIQIFQLEQAIDNKIGTYSHGMKQKITIMSALIHNPKVWILDEPLTGLDPNSIYQVKQCMKLHASEGNIVFFSSHLIDIVEKLCERIAIIKKGHILCVKTVKEIEESGISLEDFYMMTIGELDEEEKGKN